MALGSVYRLAEESWAIAEPRAKVSMDDFRTNPNSIALAGEFATLAQLALRGFDANLTLGNTKNVDILVSDPRSGKMYKLEVKTTGCDGAA